MRLFFIVCCFFLLHSVSAQSFIKEMSDTTVMSEYNDGCIWAYRQIGDFVVAMTNYEEKDDYGRYYQIAVFIKNLGNESVTFDPEKITSLLYTKQGDTLELKVYSYDRYMKKVKNAQAWAMAISGFSAGLQAGMAGHQTTYTTTFGAHGVPYTQVHTTYNPSAAYAAELSATTQMMTLKNLMSDELQTKSQGYLKITTIHPNEGVVGYMNIKRKKGERMTVNIPVGGYVYSFDWDVTKKKRQ